jgi:hypothetical protein
VQERRSAASRAAVGKPSWVTPCSELDDHFAWDGVATGVEDVHDVVRVVAQDLLFCPKELCAVSNGAGRGREGQT